ncbi:hypothetical protein BLNAU_22024 [Blattamonas nauphoetae]|uniref:Uncharacterized protein n=1 Tax=Blattamonas nauphoetae TaxID=2049346 RepID=A0ABQ9WU69_9EUKA|nr:hypothetical protein BLNAU_22024 [Blattamonas nauphoetae]
MKRTGRMPDSFDLYYFDSNCLWEMKFEEKENVLLYSNRAGLTDSVHKPQMLEILNENEANVTKIELIAPVKNRLWSKGTKWKMGNFPQFVCESGRNSEISDIAKGMNGRLSETMKAFLEDLSSSELPQLPKLQQTESDPLSSFHLDILPLDILSSLEILHHLALQIMRPKSTLSHQIILKTLENLEGTLDFGTFSGKNKIIFLTGTTFFFDAANILHALTPQLLASPNGKDVLRVSLYAATLFSKIAMKTTKELSFDIKSSVVFVGSVATLLMAVPIASIPIEPLQFLASTYVVDLVYPSFPMILPVDYSRWELSLVSKSTNPAIIYCALREVNFRVYSLAFRDYSALSSYFAYVEEFISTEQLVEMLNKPMEETHDGWVSKMKLEIAILLAFCIHFRPHAFDSQTIAQVGALLVSNITGKDMYRLGGGINIMGIDCFKTIVKSIASFRNVELSADIEKLHNPHIVPLTTHVEPTFSSLFEALTALDNSLAISDDAISHIAQNKEITALIMSIVRESVSTPDVSAEAGLSMSILSQLFSYEPLAEAFLLNSGFHSLLCDFTLAHPNWKAEILAHNFVKMDTLFRWELAWVGGKEGGKEIVGLTRRLLRALVEGGKASSGISLFSIEYLKSLHALLRAIRRSVVSEGKTISEGKNEAMEVVREQTEMMLKTKTVDHSAFSTTSRSFFEMMSGSCGVWKVLGADELISDLSLLEIRKDILTIIRTSTIANVNLIALSCLDHLDSILSMSPTIKVDTLEAVSKAERVSLVMKSSHRPSSMSKDEKRFDFRNEVVDLLLLFRTEIESLRALFADIDKLSPLTLQFTFSRLKNCLHALCNAVSYSPPLHVNASSVKWLVDNGSLLLSAISIPTVAFELGIVLSKVFGNALTDEAADELELLGDYGKQVIECVGKLTLHSTTFNSKRILAGAGTTEELAILLHSLPRGLSRVFSREVDTEGWFQVLLSVDCVEVLVELVGFCQESINFCKKVKSGEIRLGKPNELEQMLRRVMEAMFFVNGQTAITLKPVFFAIVLHDFPIRAHDIEEIVEEMTSRIERILEIADETPILNRLRSEKKAEEKMAKLIAASKEPAELRNEWKLRTLVRGLPLISIPRSDLTNVGELLISLIAKAKNRTYVFILSDLLQTVFQNAEIEMREVTRLTQQLIPLLFTPNPLVPHLLCFFASVEIPNGPSMATLFERAVDLLDVKDEEMTQVLLVGMSTILQNAGPFGGGQVGVGEGEEGDEGGEWEEEVNEEEAEEEEEDETEDEDEDNEEESDESASFSDLQSLASMFGEEGDSDASESEDEIDFDDPIVRQLQLEHEHTSPTLAAVLPHLSPVVQNPHTITKLLSFLHSTDSLFILLSGFEVLLGIFAHVPFPREVLPLFGVIVNALGLCRRKEVGSGNGTVVAQIGMHPRNAALLISTGLVDVVCERLLHTSLVSVMGECVSFLLHLVAFSFELKQHVRALLLPSFPKLVRMSGSGRMEGLMKMLWSQLGL